MKKNRTTQYIKIYRKMSFEEFEKFINGEDLIAYNEPSSETSAICPTFYFTGNLDNLIQLTIDTNHTYDVLCEFMTKKELLEEGYATIKWHLNYGANTKESQLLEYYISQYNNKMMELTNCFALCDEKQEQKHMNTISYIKRFDSDELQDEYYYTFEELDREMEMEADELLYGPGYYEELQEAIDEYYKELELDDEEYEPDAIAEGIDPRKGEMEEVIHETEQLFMKDERHIEKD